MNMHKSKLTCRSGSTAHQGAAQEMTCSISGVLSRLITELRNAGEIANYPPYLSTC